MPFSKKRDLLNSRAPHLNIQLLHPTSSHFSYLTTFFPHIYNKLFYSTVCVTISILYFLFFLLLFFFHFTTVLWIPENALKSRVLYLEMLSLSLSVSSSPRYNCRICELQLVSVTEQTWYTLHWCQVAQVNDCSVTF